MKKEKSEVTPTTQNSDRNAGGGVIDRQLKETGPNDKPLFDSERAKKLFYDSDNPDDQAAAVRMAAPFFMKHNVAADIIVNASCGRNNCTWETSKEASTIIYKSIEQFINHLIHKFYNTYVSTGDYKRNKDITETLHADAMIQVLNDIKRYDSSKSKPITFMYTSIMNGLSENIMRESGAPSRAYGVQMKKVKRAIEALKKKGIDPTIDRIREELKGELSEEQISNAINFININDTMQEFDDVAEKQRSYETPEDRVIEAENSRELIIGLNSLAKVEKDVLCLRFGFDPETYEPLGDRKSRKETAAILGITDNDAKKYEMSGMNKLRRYYNFSGTTKAEINDSYTDSILKESDVPILTDAEDEELVTICQSIITIS